MALAAVIDAGVSPQWLRQTLRRMIPDFRLEVRRELRGSLYGVHLRVVPGERRPRERNLAAISARIRRSGLPAEITTKSLEVFQRLAAAEAKVHHCPVSEVHFHEVGAVDAMVDVVGTVAGLFRLGVQTISASPLPLGRGQVRCRHGVLPLPSPAVLELLAGVPVTGVEETAELVTPTGAALVVGLASAFGPWPPMKMEKIGVGLGDHQLKSRPNLLRLILGETVSSAAELLQLEAAIDDMPAERFDFLMEQLQAAGAVEVLLVPAQMKKNRPGTLVRALLPPERREAVIEAFFRHSTTLGVRAFPVSRAALPRQQITVRTAYGRLRVKTAVSPEGDLRYHPEYDDLKAAARKAGVSLTVVEKALAEVLPRAGKDGR